ncbi:protein YgfX [Pantoea rodasii]|uniref:protein YgfX n=1 Tax=Pantoea rodasii TaxID=1076549 RepID=UPI001F0C2DC5|nr:protein YgfX [Pantoea rodasii]
MTLFLLVMVGLFSLSWPEGWRWGKALLVTLMLLECWRNEGRLKRRTGRLVVDEQGDWLWCGTRWQLARKADWLPFGVLLTLRNQQGKRWRLWLMHDNLPPYAWRTLRASCFLHDAGSQH